MIEFTRLMHKGGSGYNVSLCGNGVPYHLSCNEILSVSLNWLFSSPKGSYYWWNENPIVLSVCCRKLTPEGARCSLGRCGIPLPSRLWRENSRARKGVLHSLCPSPARALFTCSFLRPDISTLSLLSVYLAHTGFKFLFLNKALLKNNPPSNPHCVSLFQTIQLCITGIIQFGL